MLNSEMEPEAVAFRNPLTEGVKNFIKFIKFMDNRNGNSVGGGATPGIMVL